MGTRTSAEYTTTCTHVCAHACRHAPLLSHSMMPANASNTTQGPYRKNARLPMDGVEHGTNPEWEAQAIRLWPSKRPPDHPPPQELAPFLSPLPPPRAGMILIASMDSWRIRNSGPFPARSFPGNTDTCKKRACDGETSLFVDSRPEQSWRPGEPSAATQGARGTGPRLCEHTKAQTNASHTQRDLLS